MLDRYHNLRTSGSRKKVLKSCQKFSLFSNYLPSEMGMALHLNPFP